MNVRTHMSSSYHSQRGAMSLLISLVILTLITFISLYTAKTVSVEQKISGNTVQSRQAFEAAEAGMEAAISFAENGGVDRDTDDNLDANIYVNNTLVAEGATNADASNMTFVDNAQVNVVLNGTVDEFSVTTTGLSPDSSAERQIFQQIQLLRLIPNTAAYPMITRSSINSGGSGTIFNFEGDTTVWTGQDAVNKGASMKTAPANRSDAGYPDCKGGNDKYCALEQGMDGSEVTTDIIHNDDSLANLSDNEFFKNFFGMEPALYQAAMADNITYMTSAEFGGINSESAIPDTPIIWITESMVDDPGVDIGCNGGIDARSVGTLSNYDPAADISCTNANLNAKLIIVSGNVDTTGFNMLGMLFATGGVSFSGNSYIEGAVVAGGNANTTGSLDVWFNSGYLENIGQNDNTPSPISGTWRDFTP